MILTSGLNDDWAEDEGTEGDNLGREEGQADEALTTDWVLCNKSL